MLIKFECLLWVEDLNNMFKYTSVLFLGKEFLHIHIIILHSIYIYKSLWPREINQNWKRLRNCGFSHGFN